MPYLVYDKEPERINSGCIVLNKDKNKVLLVFRIKHQHYEMPGGAVNQGETLEQTAIRETKDETGCNVQIVKYLKYYDFFADGKVIRSHNFLATTNDSPILTQPDTFTGFKFVPIKGDYQEYHLAPNAEQFCKDVLSGELNL